jgi:hypothetical protein
MIIIYSFENLKIAKEKALTAELQKAEAELKERQENIDSKRYYVKAHSDLTHSIFRIKQSGCRSDQEAIPAANGTTQTH